MSPSFESLVEEVRKRATEEKQELKFLLERALIEDVRVVFSFLPNNRAVFEDIGSHNEVY